MDLGNIKRFNKPAKIEKEKFIHSAAHLLAKELCEKLNDKNFGLYLGLAARYPDSFLRRILGEVQNAKNVRVPGRLFMFLIKKANNDNGPRVERQPS